MGWGWVRQPHQGQRLPGWWYTLTHDTGKLDFLEAGGVGLGTPTCQGQRLPGWWYTLTHDATTGKFRLLEAGGVELGWVRQPHQGKRLSWCVNMVNSRCYYGEVLIFRSGWGGVGYASLIKDNDFLVGGTRSLTMLLRGS